MEGKIYGLIGEKLGHSFSVEIHNRLGLDDYKLYELPRDKVGEFLKNPELGGINVTIPYKREVIRHCAFVSDEARQIGSVNTIVKGSGGDLHAYNTDETGFEYMVKNAGISFDGKKVLIMGDGGTSLTARYAAKKMNAGETVIMSRKGDVKFTDIKKHLNADIIINTTPVGMYPNNLQALVTLSDFENLSGVVDVVYNPHRTLLILQAMELGIPYTDGIDMLVCQAKAANELFFDKKIDDGVCAEISSELRKKLDNIVLVGMPGCGKSSIGHAVAKISGKKFVDLDAEIEKSAGMSIPEIFSKCGEAHFRELEREQVHIFGRESGLVISTGGGVVLDGRNRFPLIQNGRIYHIKRDINNLAMGGRPLSKSLQALEEMYKVRYPMYCRFSSAEIENNAAVEAAAEKIWRDFADAHSCN